MAKKRKTEIDGGGEAMYKQMKREKIRDYIDSIRDLLKTD